MKDMLVAIQDLAQTLRYSWLQTTNAEMAKECHIRLNTLMNLAKISGAVSTEMLEAIAMGEYLAETTVIDQRNKPC